MINPFVKMPITVIILALLTFSLYSCDNRGQEDCLPANTSAASLQVLPLGDSRVEGHPTLYNSYRYELWKLLISDNWDVDFIGSRTDEREEASVNGICFDTDHEGTGGEVSAGILNTLQILTLQQEPDIVLLGIGGNDLADANEKVETIISNLKKIVKNLQARNDSVTIFVEQIAPGTMDFMTPQLTQDFNEYQAALIPFATEASTPSSKVILLDMNRAWSDNNMADEVHYNEVGAKIVAERYFDAIKANVTR
ncbi:MAG: GDSL-type esterase/lipase family protein [Bacteroidia bacterium]|nr:GDSL-type esterase/lipase family protein [Bacteroidia bacterium]